MSCSLYNEVISKLSDIVCDCQMKGLKFISFDSEWHAFWVEDIAGNIHCFNDLGNHYCSYINELTLDLSLEEEE